MCSIDGCFPFKWKNVSSDAADPGLGTGWAYFVDEKAYKAYVDKHKGDPDQVRPYPASLM